MVKKQDTINRIIDALLDNPRTRGLLIELVTEGMDTSDLGELSSKEIVRIYNHHPSIKGMVRTAYEAELDNLGTLTRFAKEYEISRKGLYLQLKRLGIRRT